MSGRVRVKHFDTNDIVYGYMYEKAVVVLENFDEKKEFNDINDVIELYESALYCENSDAYLTKWNDLERQKCVEKSKRIKEIVCAYLAKNITNETLGIFVSSLESQYVKVFWKLFIQLDCRVRDDVLEKVLDEQNICFLLLSSKIVNRYNRVLGNYLRGNVYTACLLMDSDVVCRDHYFFPESLSDIDKLDAIVKYVESNEAHINALELWVRAPEKIRYLTPKIRLMASNKVEELSKRFFEENCSIARCGFGVTFSDEYSEVKHEETKNEDRAITGRVVFKLSWFEKHLEFPTVLNNIFYFFDLVDFDCRCLLTKEFNKMSVLEENMKWASKGDYKFGVSFEWVNRLVDLELRAYVDFLEHHGISLERIFKWFFEDYLQNEFSIQGFRYDITSGTNWLDKCLMLGREIDHIYHQWNIYVSEGKVSEELVHLSTRVPSEEDLRSLLKEKYVYLAQNSSELKYEIFLLFSDQSLLSYTSKVKDKKYKCLFDMLLKEQLQLNDFEDFQQKEIMLLIDKGCICNSGSALVLSYDKVCILRELYEHSVICYQHKKEHVKRQIDEMVSKGQLRFEDTLLSEPEQNYMSYMLNSRYLNGLQLQNKYNHGSSVSNEEEQKHDYFVLLRATLLLIFKINDEVCLKFPDRNVDVVMD